MLQPAAAAAAAAAITVANSSSYSVAPAEQVTCTGNAGNSWQRQDCFCLGVQLAQCLGSLPVYLRAADWASGGLHETR